ncbi:MAG: RsiV family protein [Porphyromonas sp.]|nr:RsiV family protein [Porphyromonas sp.]
MKASLSSSLLTFLSILLIVLSGTSCSSTKTESQSERIEDLNSSISWNNLRRDTLIAVNKDSLAAWGIEGTVAKELKVATLYIEMSLISPKALSENLSILEQNIHRILSFVLSKQYAMIKENSMDARVNSYFSTYIENFKGNLKSYYAAMQHGDIEDEKLSSTSTWFISVKDSLVYNKSNIASIVQFVESSLGEEDRTIRSATYNIDLEKGSKIYLDSIIDTNSEELLSNLLVKSLMKKYGAETEEDLSNKGFFHYSDIHIVEDFYFSDTGLVFVFDPYEIAPSSMGRIEVDLPYNDLKPVFKNSFPIHPVSQ